MITDVPLMKATAVLIKELGWKRVATLANRDLSLAVARSLVGPLNSFWVTPKGTTYVPLYRNSEANPLAFASLTQALTFVNSTGYRIIFFFGMPWDAGPVHTAAQPFGLLDLKYVWVMAEDTFRGPWLDRQNVAVAKRTPTATNPAWLSLQKRWASVATRYDKAVHGEFNKTTHLPVNGAGFGDVWDTAENSTVGDGLLDPWVAPMYDTILILARAIHEVVSTGGSPYDGVRLHGALLKTSYEGVSGKVTFDPYSQDNWAFVHLMLSSGNSSSLHFLARTMPWFGYLYLNWCQIGCLNQTLSQMKLAPWARGVLPHDGRRLNPILSGYAPSVSIYTDGQLVRARLIPRDSSDLVPCLNECAGLRREGRHPDCVSCEVNVAGYGGVSLHAVDSSNQTLQPAGNVTYDAISGGEGIVFIDSNSGFVGADGINGRTLTIVMTFEGVVVGSEVRELIAPACPPGQIRTGAVCSKCAVGTFNAVRGAKKCENCSIGRAQNTMGKTLCDDCAAGKFSAAPGKSECLECAIGGFASKTGQRTCLTCPSPMTTLSGASDSVISCVCPVDTFRPAGAVLVEGMPDFPCRNCPRGMSCGRASDERLLHPLVSGIAAVLPGTVAPQVKPAFWSAPGDPLSIFLCQGGDTQCPGGAPASCGKHRIGNVCAECEEGWRKSGGGCSECPSEFVSKILFPTLPVVGSIAFAIPFYLVSKDRHGMASWNKDARSATHVLTIVLAYLQSGGLILKCNMELPPSGSTSAFWDLLNTPLGYLNLECAGVRSFKWFTILNLVVPLYAVVVFCVILCASMLIGRITRRPLGMDPHVMLSCFGAVFMAFYITICAASMNLFKCYSHPNGKQSVTGAPHIICYDEEDWIEMVYIAAAFTVVYCISSIAIFIWALMRSPQHQGDPSFQKTWKFLLSRFRPAQRWWAIVWLSKGLLLNLVQVVFLSGHEQLLSFQVVLSLYVAYGVRHQPWRHELVNSVDTVMHLILVLSCSWLYWFVPLPAEGHTATAATLAEKVLLPLPLALLVVYTLSFASWDYRRKTLVPAHLRETVTISGVEWGRDTFKVFNSLSNDQATMVMLAMSPVDRLHFRGVVAALLEQMPPSRKSEEERRTAAPKNTTRYVIV